LHYPNTEKNTKTTRNISTPTENSTAKMALTSWTEYHESLLKNNPWVEKLRKQSEATLEFVNNPEGLMMMVAEAAKMEEGDEDDLERIILLIPGKPKMHDPSDPLLLCGGREDLGDPWNPCHISNCGCPRTKGL
jgi:hypothetical protein